MSADKLQIASSVSAYQTLKQLAHSGARTKGVPELLKGNLVFPFDDYADGDDQLLVYECERVIATAVSANTVLAQVAFVAGERLFWDASASKITNVGSSGDTFNTPIGFCLESNDLSGGVAADDELLFELRPLSARTVCGQHTTAAASDTVVTGLAKVFSVVATLETDPADANLLVSAQIGDQAGTPAAGSILIKTWKTDGADPTPAAATSFSKKVNWVAVGV